MLKITTALCPYGLEQEKKGRLSNEKSIWQFRNIDNGDVNNSIDQRRLLGLLSVIFMNTKSTVLPNHDMENQNWIEQVRLQSNKFEHTYMYLKQNTGYIKEAKE